MPSKSLHFLAQIPQIKQLEKMISGGCYQPVSIGVPFQIHYSGFVSVSEQFKDSIVDLETYEGNTYNVAND